MIILRIAMNVSSEKHKELVQTLASIMELMEHEKGCLQFSILSDVKNLNLITLLEEWRTREDFENHLGSEMFSVLLGTKSLLKEPYNIQIYTVHQTEGEESVYETREKKRINNLYKNVGRGKND